MKTSLSCCNVVCKTYKGNQNGSKFLILINTACSDWDLRLVGGANNTEGRLEVCFDQTWGTVCDDFWGNVDAGVVCYQLGFARGGLFSLTVSKFSNDYICHIGRCNCEEPGFLWPGNWTNSNRQCSMLWN